MFNQKMLRSAPEAASPNNPRKLQIQSEIEYSNVISSKTQQNLMLNVLYIPQIH